MMMLGNRALWSGFQRAVEDAGESQTQEGFGKLELDAEVKERASGVVAELEYEAEVMGRALGVVVGELS